MRIAARIGRPRIVQIDIRDDDSRTERRSGVQTREEQRGRKVIKHSRRSTDGSPAVAFWIKCEPETRRKIQHVRLLACLTLEPRVASERQTSRGIDQPLGLDALFQCVFVEVNGAAIPVDEWEIGLPSHSVVHRPFLIDLPGVRSINSDVFADLELLRERARRELAGAAQKKVGHSQSVRLAVEAKRQLGIRIGVGVHLPVGVLGTISHLVVAVKDAEIITGRKDSARQLSRTVVSGAETACDVVAGIVRKISVGFDPDIIRSGAGLAEVGRALP